MPNRKSRRLIRQRRIFIATASGLAVLFISLIGLIVLFGFPKITSTQVVASVDAGNRFEGLADLVIPEYEQENFWWLEDKSNVVPETATDPLEEFTNSNFSRMRIAGDLLFAPDESRLNESSERAISEIVATISNRESKLAVVCHSSSDGSALRRLSLSEDRAESLATMLELKLSQKANSITRIGLGDSSPLPGIDGGTVSGRALNRRCEVFIEIVD